jgi:DNA-binding protein HU-beta
VRETVDSRVDQVKSTFEKLADRGEKVAADLRKEPLVVRVIGDADKFAEKAANEVTSVAQKVRARAANQSESIGATKPVAKKAPVAKNTPAAKTPAAKKAPAAKITTPAKKAPAAKKAAARKALATPTTTPGSTATSNSASAN